MLSHTIIAMTFSLRKQRFFQNFLCAYRGYSQASHNGYDKRKFSLRKQRLFQRLFYKTCDNCVSLCKQRLFYIDDLTNACDKYFSTYIEVILREEVRI